MTDGVHCLERQEAVEEAQAETDRNTAAEEIAPGTVRVYKERGKPGVSSHGSPIPIASGPDSDEARFYKEKTGEVGQGPC